MKANLRLMLQTGYFVGLLILIMVGIVAYRNFGAAIAQSESAAHAQATIHVAEKLLSLIEETQSDQWAYVFGSDTTALPSFGTHIHLINTYLNKLDSLSRNDAELKGPLLRLKEATFSQFDLMYYAHQSGSSAREAVVRKRVVDYRTTQTIQLLLNAIIVNQADLAERRSNEYRKFLFRTRSILLCLIGSYLAIGCVSFVFVRRNARQEEAFTCQAGKLSAEAARQEEELRSRDRDLAANQHKMRTIYEQLDQIKQEFATIVLARTAKIRRTNNRLLAEVIKRKRMAEALRKSEERFRIALHNAPIMVFNQDAELQYTWLYNNSASPVSSEAVEGKTDFDLFSPQDAQHMAVIKKHVLETSQGTSQEVQLTFDGQRRHYLLTVEPLFSKAGAVAGITCAAYDISRQKQAEEMLRDALRELKRRNHELDNYVYKVSHDLRAPLVSILGLINLVKLEADPDSGKNYISLIENRVNKLDDFIKSVLNHSRTLNSEVRITRIDFAQTIADCAEELHYLPNLNKLRITVEVSGETDFFSDPLRIAIVLKNFISNAAKYMNPFAESSYLHFNIEITEQQAKIMISDNGTGIEEQYLGRIFEMFFRGTARSDGSGLGLYIVKQTIERLQGSVTVESEVGQGTRFRILLANLKSV